MSEDKLTEQTHTWRERRIKVPFGQPANLGHGRAWYHSPPGTSTGR